MPGFPVLHHLRSLFKLMSTESVMLSNHLIFCHPLLLLLSIFPSIRVFSNESALHICPSNEYSELISFRIDWFDLLIVQGPLKSILEHHNLKASILFLIIDYLKPLSLLTNMDKMPVDLTKKIPSLFH